LCFFGKFDVSSDPIATPDRRGLCLILSSPSGAGKTTLARLLLASDASLGHSVSVTTRPARAQEADGVDYYFVTRDRFEAMRDAGELLEWAEVFGNFYGTPAEPVKAALTEGRDMLFDVDWQGASSIAALLPEDAVRIFILPPSGEELSRRIYSRGTDPEHVIEARLEGAEAEISHWGDYDYVLVNRNVEDSLAVLRGIVTAERHRRHRQVGLRSLIAQLSPPSRTR
jgi:guanylate kinase